MTDDRKCDSPKRGVKGIRDVSQWTERCDGDEGGVTVVRKCDSPKEISQLVGRCDGPGKVKGHEVYHLA